MLRLASAPDLVAADSKLYSAVPAGQVPANGFYFLNNVYGRGTLVNGVDYVQTLTARGRTFPSGAVIEWRWPAATSGAAFAYGYPAINYGDSYSGNPYGIVGPWPMQISALTALTCTYDLSPGGNLNSYDVLLDTFVTASPTSADGSYVAEISFYPFSNGVPFVGSVHTFSFGDAYVGRQGKEILIAPCAGASRRAILSATIDLKEIFTVLIALGWLTGAEYLRGYSLGAEPQVPATWNSLPHQGSLRINKLSFDWR